MLRVRFGIVLALLGATAALVAGCGGSDPNEAQTPENAVTITNGQAPTEGGSGGDDAVAAGKTTFEGSCQGCHPAGGTQAGAGPVLKDKGLAEDAIKTQIENGKGAMPGGLVSGTDLENVTAYVASIQGEAAGGGTTTAATTTAETTTTQPATTTAEGSDDGAAIAAGKTFFEGSCQGCHPAGGTQAGAGPALAGKGLAEDRITDQVQNGGTSMPGGLASGDDLKNVVKFVLSLQ